MNKKVLLTLKKTAAVVMAALMTTVTMAGCGSSAGTENASAETNSSKLSVVTTIFPEYDWVKEIAGMNEDSVDKSAADNIDLTMLLDNGVDLHSFQPTAADIARISTCDIFIYVGGESDAWVDDTLKEVKNKDMKVINLLESLGDSIKEEEVVEGMEEEDEEHEDEASDEDADHDEVATEEDADHDEVATEEDADHEGHHHEEGEIEYDEHVWLSLKNTQVLTKVIADALMEKDANHADAYRKNLEAYDQKLTELDKEYAKAVEEAKVDTILFGDRFPFRYLTDDYGLNYYAAFVGCSAETEASFETIIFLSGKVDELKLPAICVIENSDGKIAETVKENTKTGDQEIVTLNSLQATTSKDIEEGATYYSIMKENLDSLKKALGE